ncbi:MAG: SelT/SelW/SelH family protein [Dehalococcoidia bacterium]
MPPPRVEIHYRIRCKFLLRAAWLAQELLTTFEQEVGEVALVPGSGGIFEIAVEGETIFSSKKAGRFPAAKEVKELIRGRMGPQRVIGHG